MKLTAHPSEKTAPGSTLQHATLQQTTLHRAIEASWLVAIALVPLAIAPESMMAGFVQVPKVFLIRSIALLLVVLVAFDWTRRSTTVQAAPTRGIEPRALVRVALDAARKQPIVAGAAAVLFATVLSVLFSPVWIVSIAGTDAGWDSYGLFSVASYLVIFGVIASYMRTETQVRRLFWVVTASAFALGVYGVGQRFGVDWFRDNRVAPARIPLASGNPIFGAAYLLMTIPLTLAVWQGWRSWLSPVVHVAVGAGLIVPQLAAIVFTLSRGPLVAVAISLAVFIALTAWVLGKRAAARPAMILGAVAAGGLILSLLPVPGVPSAGRDLISRLASIGPELSTSGGLANRLTIWGNAAETYLTVPWVDTDRFPELPSLSVRPSRPVIGYGPDMFRHAFIQADDSGTGTETAHAHNFFVHIAVELGLVGVLAYLSVVIAVGVGLLRILRAARRGEAPLWVTHAALGLASVFVGRVVEQFTGKAQISDIALSWALAAVVVVLGANLRMTQGQTASAADASPPAEPSRRRRASRSRNVRGGGTSTDRVQWGVAIALAVASAIFWWQAIYVYVDAALLAGRAQQAGLEGRPVEAGDLLQQAVEAAPGAYPAHILLSTGWLNSARLETDSARRLRMLQTSYGLVQPVVERNPLDIRARITQGRVSSEIAMIDPAFAEQAVRDNEIVAALWPGSWRVLEELAWALIRDGDHVGSLEVVERGKALGAAGVDHQGRPADALYYLYTRQGDQELAVQAVQEAKENGGPRIDSWGRDSRAFRLFFAEATALRALGREEEVQHIIRYFEIKVKPTFPEVESMIQALQEGS